MWIFVEMTAADPKAYQGGVIVESLICHLLLFGWFEISFVPQIERKFYIFKVTLIVIIAEFGCFQGYWMVSRMRDYNLVEI